MRDQPVLLEADFENAARYFAISITVVFLCTIVFIPAIIIAAPLVYLVRKIEYDRIRCFLTERTLVVHRGILNKREQTIPLEKITDLGIVQGPIMRYCGVEAIAVETAGQSGTGGPLVTLVGVRDARGFRDRVLEQRDRMSERGDDAQKPPTPTGGDSEVLVEIRDALLRIERGLAERDDR